MGLQSDDGRPTPDAYGSAGSGSGIPTSYDDLRPEYGAEPGWRTRWDGGNGKSWHVESDDDRSTKSDDDGSVRPQDVDDGYADDGSYDGNGHGFYEPNDDRAERDGTWYEWYGRRVGYCAGYRFWIDYADDWGVCI